ncbi:HDIG domain-containing protein [Clostridium sp. 19966]|uniref:HD domain-containing protein n=1 Tax=Clostridium sp. 19966 TaxID=2768166 RepID=UPI0028DE1747|nr:HDIG domain-containing metalloprotein [Clostridium sp. 19966]MDT8718731.1 HDIG domain-containing protein [Clostridium sp. 19966]
MEKIYQKLNKSLLEDEKPSIAINEISNMDEFKKAPFSVLNKLKFTEQSIKYHPEGSVWNHTMMVVDEAAKVKDKSEAPRAFMWSALLHDIGKGETTKIRKGRITSYDHDKVGAEMVVEFFKPFNEEESFVEAVTNMTRWHMQPLFVTKSLPFADIKSMLKEVKLQEISLFSLCDRLGRGDMDKEKEREERASIDRFIETSKAHLKI